MWTVKLPHTSSCDLPTSPFTSMERSHLWGLASGPPVFSGTLTERGGCHFGHVSVGLLTGTSFHAQPCAWITPNCTIPLHCSNYCVMGTTHVSAFITVHCVFALFSKAQCERKLSRLDCLSVRMMRNKLLSPTEFLYGSLWHTVKNFQFPQWTVAGLWKVSDKAVF